MGISVVADLAVALAVVVLLAADAHSQSGWDPARYADLIDVSAERVEAAEVAPAASQVRDDLLLEAVRLRQDAADMLRAALLTREVESHRQAATRDYFVLEENIVVGLLRVRRCEEASTQLAHAVSDPLLLAAGGLATLEHLNGDIAVCFEAGAVTQGLGATHRAVAEATEVSRADGLERPADTAAAEKGPWPWLLIGVGAALGGVALGYDISLASDRDELAELQRTCTTLECSEQDRQRARELSDQLDAARWVIVGLAVGGLAAATAGLVLLLADDEPDQRASRVVPVFERGSAGLGLWVRF